MADFSIRIGGQPIRVNLGESASEAARQAGIAVAAAALASSSSIAAAEATKRANAWPDSEFKLSAGNLLYEADGAPLYGNRGGVASNATWDATFEHPYGRGAWAYNPALTTFQTYETHFGGAGTDEFAISEGDVISLGVEVIAPSGTVSLAARFVNSFNPTGYTNNGGQISGSAGVTMNGTSKILKVENMTVPAGAVGLRDYLFDGTSSAFRVIRRWVVKGPVAGDAPPIRSTEWEKTKRVELAVGESLPNVAPQGFYGQRLRRFRSFAEQRESGEAARFQMGLIGDSWSTNEDYLSAPFSRAMKAIYGDGGVGWFGLGFTGSGSTAGDADGVYYATRTGTWTRNYATGSTSPNVSDARSSTAGSIYQIRNVSGASRPALSAVLLQYTGTADAVIRWRWQGGEWSANTPAQTAGQNTVNLTGFPSGALSSAGANTDNLEIEVVSGSVILGGIDFQSATDGIVIHKLGASGSKATDWLTSNAAAWQAGLALLGIDGASILFGTNEDANGQASGTIAGAYEDLAARVQAAVPAADMLLAVAPENQLVNSTDMTTYASAIAALVAGVSPTVFAAFCDLQPAYGDPASKADYASGGDFPLMNADGVHPNADGARVNARELRLTWTVR